VIAVSEEMKKEDLKDPSNMEQEVSEESASENTEASAEEETKEKAPEKEGFFKKKKDQTYQSYWSISWNIFKKICKRVFSKVKNCSIINMRRGLEWEKTQEQSLWLNGQRNIIRSNSSKPKRQDLRERKSQSIQQDLSLICMQR